MNKQSFISILLTVLMSMTGAKSFSHDIAATNSVGVTIYYVWANNEKTELAVSYRGSEESSYSNEYSGIVVIPETVDYEGNTYRVTSIGDYAFWECKSLTSVIIHNGISNIGKLAFGGCNCITSITLPNCITSIGDGAFWGSGLKSVVIPNNLTSIGSTVFRFCDNLTSIIIPNSVKTIGDGAFWCCNALSSVIIGSGVTSISSSAFYGTNLKKTIWLTNTPPSGYSSAAGTVNYVSNDQFTSLSNTVKYQFLSSYFDVDGIRYVPVSPSEKTCDAIDCVYDESAANTKLSSTISYKGVTMNVKNIQP